VCTKPVKKLGRRNEVGKIASTKGVYTKIVALLMIPRKKKSTKKKGRDVKNLWDLPRGGNLLQSPNIQEKNQKKKFTQKKSPSCEKKRPGQRASRVRPRAKKQKQQKKTNPMTSRKGKNFIGALVD